MSIKFVILGYLDWRPLSGYDLKKIIASSEILPWTANNNQIYRALVQLHEEGWVSKTVEGGGWGSGPPYLHRHGCRTGGTAGLVREPAGAAPLQKNLPAPADVG